MHILSEHLTMHILNGYLKRTEKIYASDEIWQ